MAAHDELLAVASDSSYFRDHATTGTKHPEQPNEPAREGRELTSNSTTEPAGITMAALLTLRRPLD